MKITSKTLYEDFAPFEDLLTEDSYKELMHAVEGAFTPYGELTLSEFWQMIEGDLSRLGDLKHPTAFQMLYVKGFAKYVDDFMNVCKRLKLAPTTEQQQAAIGTIETNPKEGMLIFVREYFGLHSFVADGDITLNEYLIARKDAYNQALIKRNYERLQIQRINNNKR